MDFAMGPLFVDIASFESGKMWWLLQFFKRAKIIENIYEDNSFLDW